MSVPAGDERATGGGPLAPPVAGVDLLTRHDRDGDGVVERLVALLHADPRSAPWAGAAVGATHVSRLGEPHVTVSLAVPAPPDAAWPALTGALEVLRDELAAPAAALVLGGRSSGAPGHTTCAAAAAAEHGERASGRAVRYPGVASLTGDVSVRDVVRRSAIEAVLVVAGGEAPAAAVVRTRDFVRPVWTGGRLVLHVQPAAGGVLVPFEVPDPTPCCADHG